MIRFLVEHLRVRIVLCEKTDRLYRDFKDDVTLIFIGRAATGSPVLPPAASLNRRASADTQACNAGYQLFPATDFIAELLQHMLEPRLHLIRRYGLCASRSRGTWLCKPHLVRLAPEGGGTITRCSVRFISGSSTSDRPKPRLQPARTWP